jgi:predicted chitinase
MTKTPIRLLDLFKYFKSKSHQIAAIGELEAAILAADPTILNREKDWYNTWSTSIKEKAPEWLITRRQVAEISGHNEALFDDVFMDDLNRLVYAADMTRLNQRRMLIAQTCHETCGYKYMTEIGDRAYFTRMYDNRSDLGNTEPGDGYKYRGCGVIQLTGKYNFSRFHRWMERNGMRDDRIMEGTDYVANKYPFLCAICWIEENNWAFLCERGDIFECTRRLNGGYNGIDDRIFYYEKAKKAIKE